MMKKLFGVLLALCLVVGLAPVDAQAAEQRAAIQLVNTAHTTGGINGWDSTNGYDYVYYGSWANKGATETSPLKWRVLAIKTNTGSDGLFLLSEELLGDSSTDGGVYFSPKNYNTAWQGSKAQNWCKDFAGEEGSSVADAFSAVERAAIQETIKNDVYFGFGNQWYQKFYASENILNGDKVFFLSAEEVMNEAYGFTNDTARKATGAGSGTWWLRSLPTQYSGSRGVVRDIGDVSALDASYDWAARPAFNINLNSVLFTSAALGGKSSAALGSISKILTTATNEWKFTLKDDTRNSFTASLYGSSTVTPGTTITLTYNEAKTGTNEYVSAILTDVNGNALYYGRLVNNSASGTVSIVVPSELTGGTYTLNVFSEQYNGDKQTDYASPFRAVQLTVDNSAPTLSNGSAERASVDAATVKFTSSESGTYYYAVVDSGANAPEINTTGAGATCTAGENAFSLTGLSDAKAKDVYIVAKDAADNVSAALKIEIPAMEYAVSISVNPTEGGTVSGGGAYAAGASVTVTATPNTGYLFVNWTASGEVVSRDASYTFTAAANRELVAVFEQLYSVNITPGEGMTLNSGEASQTVMAGNAMADVVYTANSGYYFPETYSVEPVNGVSVIRNSATQITVSGTPTANTELALPAATAQGKEAMPAAVFTATGDSTGTLSNVTAGMQYSLDGSTWTDISSESVDLTGLNACTIYVVKKGDGVTTLDSDAQTIIVTKADAPADVTAASCTTADNNDGRLQGVNENMEYKAAASSEWTSVSGTEITGLVPGDYHVRVKASGTVLASEAVPLTVGSYVVAIYTVTFEPNGGIGTMAPQVFTEGVAQNLTLNAFTREGFTFTGWNTAADGSGTSFADGASVTASSNAVLYAQWKAVPVVNPLTIIKQPTDQFVVEGQRAEFSIEATGDGITYQWYINRNDGRGWRELDGAVGNVYITSVTDLDCDGFQYGCLIKDQHGNTLKSDVAVLYVTKVPVLPETGDSATPMLWLAMSVLSVAGILLLRKKAFCR